MERQEWVRAADEHKPLRAKKVLKARIILSLEEAVFTNEVERAVRASSGAHALVARP